jgi:hypothetical protein
MDHVPGKLPKGTVPYVLHPVVERVDEPVMVIVPATTSLHAAVVSVAALPPNVIFPFGKYNTPVKGKDTLPLN